ncbi:hypothetical protein OUO20_12450 [Arthrobacter sp. FX8]|uniref:LamG-like jellyroll fold domain-containing protein n=1 Tax=Arthrobacter sp. FX8 TaxID=2997335 RepID=UPI00227D43D3|nr:LamG-like jellyroll fold domain-containing protein [Arthrobacter sp. FX8]WAJ32001.1 hypothetical protein OUO20_12450 [Arthrobacter sp. FX8]
MGYMKDYRGRHLDSFHPGRDANRISSYDASTLTGANGSSLVVWPDSGVSLQDLTQPTTGAQPTVTANSLNGLRTVRLGATSYMARSDFGANFENGGAGYAQPLTIAALYRVSSTGSRAANGALTGWASPASSNRPSMQVDTSGSIALFGASAGATGGKPVNDDQWHITIAQFDTGSSSFYTDGYLVAGLATQAHGTSVLRGFAIGAAVDGSAPLGVSDIAQVDVLSGRLTRVQIDNYTQYLATKWGLS